MQAHDSSPAATVNPYLASLKHWLLRTPKKVPHYANGRPRGVVKSGAKFPLDTPEDREQWATYAEAKRALKQHPTWGLGLAIADGLQFIDLDGCFDPKTQRATTMVEPLLKAAADLGAYIEMSMSGRGFHIIGAGPAFAHEKSGPAEVFCEKRYCAMGTPILTGNDVLPDLTPLLPLVGLANKPKAPLRLVTKASSPITWPGDRETVKRCLAKLDPDMGREDWIKAGMAIHHASGGSEEGFDYWDRWSSEATRDCYSQAECVKQWRSFKADGKVTLGTLVHMAESDDPSPVTADDEVDDATDFIKMSDLLATKYPPIPWVVDGLIAPGLTLFSAPVKTGKSYLVLQMCMCAAAGKPFLGRATNARSVTYYSLEEDPELVQERAKKVHAAHGGNVGTLKVRKQVLPGEAALASVEARMREGDKLIVVDIFARIRDPGSEDQKAGLYNRDYNAIAPYADLAAAYPGVALVIVHHLKKAQTDTDHWSDRVSGSAGLTGAAHTLMVMSRLDKRRTDEDNKAEVSKFRTLHVVGKRVREMDVMLKMMSNDGGWEESELSEQDVLTTGKQSDVLKLLKQTEWTTGHDLICILEDTEKPTSTQKNKWHAILARMVKLGLIESEGKGGRGYRLKKRA